MKGTKELVGELLRDRERQDGEKGREVGKEGKGGGKEGGGWGSRRGKPDRHEEVGVWGFKSSFGVWSLGSGG